MKFNNYLMITNNNIMFYIKQGSINNKERNWVHAKLRNEFESG
jgi:hypothetical protein